MRRPVIVTCEPRVQIEDDLRVDVAADALLGVIADLLGRAERTGTRREVAQVVLAAAHVDEAVGLLRTIQPAPNACELGVRHAPSEPDLIPSHVLSAQPKPRPRIWRPANRASNWCSAAGGV
jgi:hypothetical protein